MNDYTHVPCLALLTYYVDNVKEDTLTEVVVALAFDVDSDLHHYVLYDGVWIGVARAVKLQQERPVRAQTS